MSGPLTQVTKPKRKNSAPRMTTAVVVREVLCMCFIPPKRVAVKLPAAPTHEAGLWPASYTMVCRRHYQFSAFL